MSLPNFAFIHVVNQTAADLAAVKAKQLAQDVKLDQIVASQQALLTAITSAAQAVIDTQNITMQVRDGLTWNPQENA